MPAMTPSTVALPNGAVVIGKLSENYIDDFMRSLQNLQLECMEKSDEQGKDMQYTEEDIAEFVSQAIKAVRREKKLERGN